MQLVVQEIACLLNPEEQRCHDATAWHCCGSPSECGVPVPAAVQILFCSICCCLHPNMLSSPASV